MWKEEGNDGGLAAKHCEEAAAYKKFLLKIFGGRRLPHFQQHEQAVVKAFMRPDSLLCEPPRCTPEAAQPVVSTLPSTFTLEQAIELQDLLIQEYSKSEFQLALHQGWTSSCGDEVQRLKARRAVTLPIQGPIIQRFGFPATVQGVQMSVKAFFPFNEHPEIARRNEVMNFLVNPACQDRAFVERHLASSGLLAASLVSMHNQVDKELVELARSGVADELRRRVEQQHADPNVVLPDRLDFLNDARIRFYFIEERTPLIAAVENGHEAVFDLLLGFEHFIDVNTVCFEWSWCDCYKRYTALDVGDVCKRKKTHPSAERMVAELLSRGALPGEDLPEPERGNPFRCWRKHFPNAELEPRGFGSGSGQEFPEEQSGGGAGRDARSGAFGGAAHESEPSPTAAPLPPLRFPPLPQGASPELEQAIAALRKRLSAEDASIGKTFGSRQSLLRHLFLEWHPDKRPKEQELATKVFQWLQGVKDGSS